MDKNKIYYLFVDGQKVHSLLFSAEQCSVGNMVKGFSDKDFNMDKNEINFLFLDGQKVHSSVQCRGV